LNAGKKRGTSRKKFTLGTKGGKNAGSEKEVKNGI